ncbi:MarR family transcriptional regulator [Actinacidiphila soli]|uniref:MarR family transcriptional regulator n=1 Tax=Actinacidiphila soli TaxID=2487275 RepID=UPI00389903CA
MAAAGLSLARTKLLRVLDEQGPTRLSSLADQLGFAARTVTETVDGLERDGPRRAQPGPHRPPRQTGRPHPRSRTSSAPSPTSS